MINLNLSSTPRYLADRGFDPASVKVTELAGGVSNIVLLVEHPDGRFVLKQALPRLRVEQEWLCDMRRIFTEAEALKTVHGWLPGGSTPEVLFEDRPNFAFAMTAAPEKAEPWKSQLLRGVCDTRIAEDVGSMLAALIRAGWQSEAMLARFADLEIFEQLRLEPYYRRVGAMHPDLQPRLERLIESCRTRRVSLVHGDWSPKNILVSGREAMAIDFEVMHFGDPSFDAAFLLNHLLLKTFHGIEGAPVLAKAFWTSLIRQMPDAPWFEAATVEHLGGLLLARIDGKSPAEYIRAAEAKERIRGFARGLIMDPPKSVEGVWERYAAER